MFSGKTTSLMGYYNKYRHTSLKLKFIISNRDNRYTNDPYNIVNHDNIILRVEEKVIEGDTLDSRKYKDDDVILVDEGQFFKNLKEFALDLHYQNKIVIISMLNLKFDATPFGDYHDLLLHASQVDIKTAVCFRCKSLEAKYTHRKDCNKESIIVGGKESYESLCLDCINNISKIEEETEGIYKTVDHMDSMTRIREALKKPKKAGPPPQYHDCLTCTLARNI